MKQITIVSADGIYTVKYYSEDKNQDRTICTRHAHEVLDCVARMLQDMPQREDRYARSGHTNKLRYQERLHRRSVAQDHTKDAMRKDGEA